MFYSQYGEDLLIKGLFDKPGIFVDIGAYDGIKYSNTYLLEQYGWTGICIEPVKDIYDKLVHNRKCKCFNYAGWCDTGYLKFTVNKTKDFMSGVKDTMLDNNIEMINNGTHESEIETIPCIDINKIFEENQLSKIDVLNIDVEGSEYLIIERMDFDNYDINVLIIENNHGYKQIMNRLLSKGYGLLATMGQNNIYVKNLSKLNPYMEYTYINYKDK